MYGKMKKVHDGAVYQVPNIIILIVVRGRVCHLPSNQSDPDE